MKRQTARNYGPLQARGRAGGVHADQRPSSKTRRRKAKHELRRGGWERA